MTLRRSPGGINNFGIAALPLKDDDAHSQTPLQYLESASAAKTLSKTSSLFLNTKFTSAVLIACLAMAASAWLWQKQPEPFPETKGLQSTLLSFEETVEALSGFVALDIRDIVFSMSGSSSHSIEQARVAVQRWMDMNPVIDSIEDLLAQRKSKVNEIQLFESKLRIAATAYHSAREAAELYSTSAKSSINLLRKFQLDEQIMQTSINSTKENELELHQKLLQHDLKIADWRAKRDAVAKELNEINVRCGDQSLLNDSLAEDLKYYQAQVSQHNASVAEASKNLKTILKSQEMIESEISAKKSLLENLILKEQEKQDLLSTIESIQRQFAVIARGSPQDEATISLKSLMDAEEREIENFTAELAKVSAPASFNTDNDNSAYESSLHRSRIRLQRVEHELRYESIRFIFESIPIGIGATIPAVLAIVDSHIELARDRLEQIKSSIRTAQDCLTAAEKHFNDNASQIERLNSVESDADIRYATLVASLKETESRYQQEQHTLTALNDDLQQKEALLAKVKLDYEVLVAQKHSCQQDLLQLGEDKLAQQHQAQKLQESQKSIQLCSSDMNDAIRHLNNLNAKYEELQQLTKSLSTLNESLSDLEQHLQQRSQRLLDAINSGFCHSSAAA